MESQDINKTDTPINSSVKIPKGREIDIKLSNGLKVGAKCWGPPDSEIKILCLHGWLDNAGTWDALAPLLAMESIHLVCIDFAGHGKSDHCPTQVDPFYLIYVDQVVDTIYALGWSSVNIMAHSMGAGVATLVAGAAPHLVKNLILVEGLGPFSSRAAAVVQLEEYYMERRKYLKRQPKTYPSIDDCIRKLLINNPSLAEKTGMY